MSSEFDELVAAIEAADHGSYALEREIALLIGSPTDPPRNYTVSIDAAMSLVPEGCRIRELGQWDDNGQPSGWFCTILRWEQREDGVWGERAFECFEMPDGNMMPRLAPTAPLALCIAALRARRRG